MQFPELWHISKIIENFYPIHSQIQFPQIGQSLQTANLVDAIILQIQMRQGRKTVQRGCGANRIIVQI